MKKNFTGIGFFGKIFLATLIFEVVALWISLLVVPGLLIFLTGNANWAWLYVVTFPLFMFVAAWFEMQGRVKKEKQ